MAIICPGGTLPTQPGPESGWKYTSTRFGLGVSTKTPASHFTLQGMSITSELLRGTTLVDLRKTYFRFVSNWWTSGDNFDKASFLGAAYGWPITNIHGVLVSPSGISLFKHYCETAFLHHVQGEYVFGPKQFLHSFTQITAGDTEPAPPNITSASWDGADNWSITVSNYGLVEPYTVAIYTTLPNVITPSASHLFQLASLDPYSSTHPWNSEIFFPLPSQILKPWPKNSSVLFGCRIWLGDPRFYLPSPLAAVLIDIS